MQLILTSRNEVAGMPKVQLRFTDEATEGPANGVHLSGWFDAEIAAQFTVGAAYVLSIVPEGSPQASDPNQIPLLPPESPA